MADGTTMMCMNATECKSKDTLSNEDEIFISDGEEQFYPVENEHRDTGVTVNRGPVVRPALTPTSVG